MGLPFFDSHAHLDAPQFEHEAPEVIERAVQAGLEFILTIGTGVESSRRAVELAHRRQELYASVAIDPHGASAFSEDAYQELKRLSGDERVIAIGETGLDYHYFISPVAAQQMSFRRHIQLALERRLPLVIHNRKADEDVLRILAEEDPRERLTVILHCFDASLTFSKACLNRGAYLSFSGMITFPKRTDLQEIAASVPEDRLLVETDSPYLAPAPLRGRRNEPAFIVQTFEKLAHLRGVPLVQLVPKLRDNLRRVFGI